MRLFAVASFFAALTLSSCSNSESAGKGAGSGAGNDTARKGETAQAGTAGTPWNNKTLDSAAYNRIMKELANGDTTGKWPVKDAPLPRPGAVLPFYRVIAYYGNLFSKRMGVLGEYPRDSMLMMLKNELNNWQKADPSLPVMPALHYVAITAQGAPGKDGKYRLRMPHHQIDTIMNWAKTINALTFVDIQVGHSNVMTEVPTLEAYLKQPTVHLGLDPEFSMKGGEVPGRKIGTYDATDINWVIDYLARIVRENNLPPKILVVHRFTNPMVRNFQNIKKVPEVQIVMDMDGWGDPVLKKSSYKLYEQRDPVQFTGFKIFYKNDLKIAPHRLMTPEEVLAQTPKPIYIQYQ